jgi:hypothetical protein
LFICYRAADIWHGFTLFELARLWRKLFFAQSTSFSVIFIIFQHCVEYLVVFFKSIKFNQCVVLASEISSRSRIVWDAILYQPIYFCRLCT